MAGQDEAAEAMGKPDGCMGRGRQVDSKGPARSGEQTLQSEVSACASSPVTEIRCT